MKVVADKADCQCSREAANAFNLAAESGRTGRPSRQRHNCKNAERLPPHAVPKRPKSRKEKRRPTKTLFDEHQIRCGVTSEVSQKHRIHLHESRRPVVRAYPWWTVPRRLCADRFRLLGAMLVRGPCSTTQQYGGCSHHTGFQRAM